ncbi:MAG: VWA domain-containing protein, partial [Deltaproteobacteria bacterium]|nr:VWA domain-containing protein [Deltaproteobacteria bacterium]
MNDFVTITVDDMRTAVLRRVKLDDVEADVRRRMKLPVFNKTASSSLFYLQQCNTELGGLVAGWMQGRHPEAVEAEKPAEVVAVPFTPSGIDVPLYLRTLMKKGIPPLIAVDASSAEIGAALHYGCSLLYGLKLAVRVGLIEQGQVCGEFLFRPGDFLPELAVFCFWKGISLVPLAAPPRLVASEYQFNYNRMLEEAHRYFVEEEPASGLPEELEQRALQIMQPVFGSGMQLRMEREDLITQTCYTVSRLYDLARFVVARKSGPGPIPVLYKMQHVLDFGALQKTFWRSGAAVDELYSHLDPQPTGAYAMRPSEDEDALSGAPARSAHGDRAARAIDRWLEARRTALLDLGEVDRLAAEIALALRRHPAVERSPGVRATLATREIAQGFGLMHGSVSRQSLARAAWLGFSHRFKICQAGEEGPGDILKSILARVVFGMPLYPLQEESKSEKRRPMTPEEIKDALAGLSETALRELEPGEALPLDDPRFAEEAMQHPMVQQAMKDALESGQFEDMQQGYQDMLGELEDRDYVEQLDSSSMTLSEDARRQVSDSMQERMSRGEVTPEDVAEALQNTASLPCSPGIEESERMQLAPGEESELLAEMMDFQHQAKSETTSLEDLYIHYTLDEKKGIEVSDKKLDYEKLKVMVHELEKKGLVETTATKKGFSVSHRSLTRLLEGLVRRQETQVLERRAFRREHEPDKTEVRRYRRGDVFSDISLRHSIRRIIRKGKGLKDINYTDLRAFEKKPSNQLDIAVCVDISASMKESGKLRYAKIAVAELARAAVDKHDRLGIVAFSNLGEEVVSLSDRITPLLDATMTLRAHQFTNIGNGLACARKMLLNDRRGNPKYIILITDGSP